MQYLLIVNAIVFGLLFAMWSNDGGFNWFLKITLLIMFIFNGIFLLEALGYIVKA